MTSLLVGDTGRAPTPVAPRASRRTAPRRRIAPGASRAIGPALLVAAGYVDPGNWGTDVAAGAQFGYRLVWVLAVAIVAALFLQHLAARIGFVTGSDLATLMRERMPRPASRAVFPPLLVALAITEVVEVLGVVIGVQMLTGWPVTMSVVVATSLVLAVFLVPRGVARGAVYGCLGLVGVVYLAVLALNGGGAVAGMVPSALPSGGLPVAVGLIGAVVMPHNILLHSTLARDLRVERVGLGPLVTTELRRLQRASFVTTAGALGVAFAVNCAIVSVAAEGSSGKAGIVGALQSAPPTFGAATTALFAITLIGAGLASSVTGGLVSADVLRRFLPRLRLPDLGRRCVCLVPATVVVASGVPEVTVLVWSQVVLTVALPLVLVPLVVLGSHRSVVGAAGLSRSTQVAAGVVTATLCVAGIASVVGS